MRVKICGITVAEQAQAIARLGATALGFICAPASPRYVTVDQISAISQALQTHPQTAGVQRIGVFVDAPVAQISQAVTYGRLTGVQLHGSESPETCQRLRLRLPEVEIIKAFRVRSPATLATIAAYHDSVDTLLLDAFHPQAYGGTGQTLDWTALASFQPKRPWILAGGLTPGNIGLALSQLQPDGIDLSSGVEQAPGQKDILKVTQLFQALTKLVRV